MVITVGKICGKVHEKFDKGSFSMVVEYIVDKKLQFI